MHQSKKMSSNNHALIRYKTIDRCLKSTAKNYFLKDLIKECSDAVHEYEEHRTGKQQEYKLLGRRTILYDLKFMKDEVFGFGAPIEHDRKEGYFYTDSRFEAFKARISKSDIEKLSEALSILKQLSGESQFKDLESMVTRLEETYNIRRRAGDHSVVYFEHSTNIEGQKWVSKLKGYITKRQTLRINYEPFGKQAYSRFISPYFLKEYNNRWFLFGWDHDVEKITTLGMDRIKDIEESIKEYYKPQEFNESSYHDDVVGVTIPSQAKKIELIIRAHGKRINYLETKPIHPNQVKIKQTDEYADFKLAVIPNFELQTKIMEKADSIEVRSPDWFREEILKRLRRAASLYGSSGMA